MKEWLDMKEAPKDGSSILVAFNNGCAWEYFVVRWTGDYIYPWATIGNAYPNYKFDCWQPIKEPYDIAEDFVHE